jgi:hypothetical protein
MNSAVSILRRERDAAAEEAKALRIRIKDLDAAIAVLEQQAPPAKNDKRPDKDMKSLVIEALAAAGSEGLLLKDIVSALAANGRNSTEPSVASTLSRLKSDAKVDNDRGKWFIKGLATDVDTELPEDDDLPETHWDDDPGELEDDVAW